MRRRYVGVVALLVYYYCVCTLGQILDKVVSFRQLHASTQRANIFPALCKVATTAAATVHCECYLVYTTYIHSSPQEVSCDENFILFSVTTSLQNW